MRVQSSILASQPYLIRKPINSCFSGRLPPNDANYRTLLPTSPQIELLRSQRSRVSRCDANVGTAFAGTDVWAGYRLGIMNMFGGFTQDFFDAYHEVIPRTEPYYNERLRLYELYHHLNHLLMFRGGYRSGAISIMRSLIRFCDKVDAEK
ncbi:fructosamine-3-kinase [Pseudozyma hubeiensis SY62]|uniref:protein-ribulosamine 3-kinase n=1 Tax=Pseudozyma hubeiensis (strain SY62) TaxID=1305764 RepID=R9P722_PSEHS|nr:fructosamine-3-kinase [Pseudozyma hubeiensis SY62]GAC93870.1 fructosamine-3-kinase [Pseudozyma hubeiensis SY62]